ncbi:LOW QUALITY PROTEIN: protein transport protein Sec31A [Gadus morhua]|uniref:LOW QUALITY PROTEIN: protein transport protein Sec31A n=1 Tax=Gadus morhua TaxID=8049 RepID=UPI0011B47CE1|nr:LOW QUALITY PROTEIN: protein transport protein Sec31A [Gadus morhua]
MKLKEINRTAIQSWSPSQQHPIYLATGTSAQQLDASFSTNACLEIFELDLADTSLDMKSCGTFSSSHRFHKLVWSPHGMDGAGHPNGVLIAGGENGDVILYDPAKIMAGDDDVIITQSDKHTGPVRALDVNPFQANLVASAGNESEIYIWDLNNFGSPMTPGPKTQPLEDISCVAWNRQVQHILASASPSGRASVWDLRKNDLIIKVSDHSNRMHCSGLAWNPEVATQLVLSSEDDRMPVIQMWDLRFATSPLKILENHTRGVLAMDWSLADPELLLSCGKDNRILCWNPNTAEVLYELPTSTQWCFDIKWCPRNPAVLSAAAFDGNIGIYSIMGGSSQAQNQRQADQITNSFGNMDPFGTGQALPPLQMPQAPCPAPPAMVNPLKKPPKWIRRPVGASFAFGGKLVTLDNAPSNPQQPAKHVVHVSQVVTETAFLERSDLLQATLSNGNFVDFCQEKIAAAQDGFERTVWSFLKVNFDSDVRGQYLDLLGYKKEELALKISTALKEMAEKPETVVRAPATLQPTVALEPTEAPEDLQPTTAPDAFQPVAAPAVSSFMPPPADISPEAVFDLISAANLQPADEPAPALLPEEPAPAPLPEDEFDLDLDADSPVDLGLGEELDQELEEGEDVDLGDEEDFNLEEEEEEEILLQEDVGLPEDVPAEPADQTPVTLEDSAVVPEIVPDIVPDIAAPPAADDTAAPAAPVAAPAAAAPAPAPAPTPAAVAQGGVHLAVSQDVDGLITQALLTGDFEGAVDLCILDNRMADSIILAIAGGSELLEKTQKKYFSKTHTKLTKLISAVVMKDWTDILTSCDLANWKEPLAAVMTYARPDEFSAFCDLLGGRLEVSQDAVLQAQASLCYICAGNVEKVVSCWTRAQAGYLPLSLQDLVEKVVVLRRAVEQARRGGAAPTASSVLLEEMMGQYAGLLASQGSLATALAYLSGSTNQQLHKRLTQALGQPQQQPQQKPQPQQQQQQQPFRPGRTPMRRRRPAPGPLYNPGPPSMGPSQPAPGPAAPQPTSTPPQPQYYQPVRAASTVTSWSNQTPTALPSIPPVQLASGPDQQNEPLPPPNPTHGMPAPGPAAAGGPPPSSAPGYMYAQQYQPQVSHYGAPGTGPNYQPFQYPAASLAAPPSPTSLPPAPGFRSQYMQPGPGPSPVYQPLSCSPPYNAPYFPTAPTSSSASSSPTYAPGPLAHGTPFQHGGPGSPVSYMQSPFGGPGPQNGWNDPPALNRAGTKKKGLENYTPPAPITAPIMGPPGSDPQAQPMSPVSLQGSMDPGQGAFQGPFSGRQQLPPSSGGHPAMPQTSVEGPPGAPTGDHIQPMQSIPAEKILKKPIPEEHVVLKTTFEGVIQKCLAVASDPQTKRKLDDASKRLEALYDKLREQSLSPAIVGGLHNIARSIESRAYTDGLNIHTHIVSSSNFSETSAFMPVLKVVLTQANKLGV